ncbi:MAG: hypothetical protein LBL42_06645 [Tannerella sp.]|jgi:hypothetical protein|nr:hypothetical protein [Tannerella sp.]
MNPYRTAREIRVQKQGQALRIRYSKTDFFSEGQEKQSEDTEKAGSMDTETKSEINGRFSGQFNIFL